jgi:hypothetical protein
LLLLLRRQRLQLQLLLCLTAAARLVRLRHARQIADRQRSRGCALRQPVARACVCVCVCVLNSGFSEPVDPQSRSCALLVLSVRAQAFTQGAPPAPPRTCAHSGVAPARVLRAAPNTAAF